MVWPGDPVHLPAGQCAWHRGLVLSGGPVKEASQAQRRACPAVAAGLLAFLGSGRQRRGMVTGDQKVSGFGSSLGVPAPLPLKEVLLWCGDASHLIGTTSPEEGVVNPTLGMERSKQVS